MRATLDAPPVPDDDLTGQIDAAIGELAGLAGRADYLHDLIHARGGIDYGRPRRGRDPDAPPVGRWDPHWQPTNWPGDTPPGAITAAADHDGATRWARGRDHLIVAWHHLRKALAVYTTTIDAVTSPLEHSRGADDLRAACRQLAGGLHILAVISRRPDIPGVAHQLPPAQTDHIRSAVAKIALAVDQLPDIADPPQPAFCRNPRGRGLCRVEVTNDKQQLCTSCDQHERDRQRATTRRHRRR